MEDPLVERQDRRATVAVANDLKVGMVLVVFPGPRNSDVVPMPRELTVLMLAECVAGIKF